MKYSKTYSKQSFLEKYFSRRTIPYWGVLAFDSVIVLFSLFVAHVINSGLITTLSNPSHLVYTLLLYLICYLIFFKIFRTYSAVVRYSSSIDLLKVVFAICLGSILAQTVRLLINSERFYFDITAHDLFVGSLIAITLMCCSRMLIKVAFDHFSSANHAVNVMIIGTKKGGISLAHSIRSQYSRYELKGFITHSIDMAGHTLMGRPVFMHDDPSLWSYISSQSIRMIMISPYAQEGFVNEGQDVIDRMISLGIKIMVVPKEQEWDGKSDLSYTNFSEVDVEDLLPREKIEVNLQKIGDLLAGKRVFITGAAGSIGQEIVNQVAQFSPEELVLVDQAETPMHDLRMMMAEKYPDVRTLTVVASITAKEYMELLFKSHRPQYVFHAAAYKHVPMMESNPSIAVQNNIVGTRILADLAVKYGTLKFVMISTDKAVNPTSVMGCSKRICEIYCQSLNQAISSSDSSLHQADGSPAVTQFVTTRFGNVLGSNGSVIPIFREQIRRGGPVKVTDPNIVRYFMLIPEACKLVLEAATIGKGGEIFVFDMGAPVKIADLARRMIDLSGKHDVKIKYVGLRPGEKMYEEVLGDGEKDIPTFHRKIKIAAVREYPYEEALRHEEELLELSRTGDAAAIIGKMGEIVPEYTPSEQASMQYVSDKQDFTPPHIGSSGKQSRTIINQ